MDSQRLHPIKWAVTKTRQHSVSARQVLIAMGYCLQNRNFNPSLAKIIEFSYETEASVLLGLSQLADDGLIEVVKDGDHVVSASMTAYLGEMGIQP